jgi:hypothetical protein
MIGGRVVTTGCPHCSKSFQTINQLMDHLAEDVLPGILETAFATATKFVYCDNCKTAVDYEKSVLDTKDGGTGLEIVCKRCHTPICTFMDTKPAATEEQDHAAVAACTFTLATDSGALAMPAHRP